MGEAEFDRATVHELATEMGTIRYRELGDGEPLVFVHGLIADGRLWRKVVPALAGRYRCIVADWPLGAHRLPMRRAAALDPPGLADIVAEFVDTLGAGPVTLVGNDTGGAICQIVAARRPDVVARLVLTNCDAYENFLPPLFRSLQMAGWVPGAVWLLLQVLRARRPRRLPMAFGRVVKGPLDDDLIDSWFAAGQSSHAVRRDAAKVLRGISARHTMAAAEALRTLPAPVLIAWAPEDTVFTVHDAQRLAADIPDARLVLIEDSLTFIPEDQPERLAEEIAAFVAATSGVQS